MRKKGVSRTFLIIGVVIIVVVIAFLIFFLRGFPLHGLAIKLSPDEDEVMESKPISSEEQEEGIGLRKGRARGGGGGGDGGGGGEGSDAGSSELAQEETDETEEPEDSEPTATLRLLDFDYQIVESDLVEITSLTYSVDNVNRGPISLELLLYIYGEDDDGSKKGIVRDQIKIGQLNYMESITKTITVSAYYRGDLATEKVFKITLIGYLLDKSYNLGSVSEDLLFE